MNRISHLKLFKTLALRLLGGCICLWAIAGVEVQAEESKPRSYTLQEIIDLTLTHNPTIELGKGIIDEKAAEEVTAHAYSNPSFSVQSGYGKVRDPRGTSLDRKSTRLNSSHTDISRMPSSA